MENIFFQISTLLAITVTIALFMRVLKQPLIVSYLVAGIVSGPIFLNIIHGDTEIYEALSQFGIVLLLFMIGLSLNFDHIKKIGKAALISGTMQIVVTAFAGFFVLVYMGFGHVSALYLAIAITFSSTIVIVKILSDKRDTESTYGRYVIGLMIVQDLIAIAILMIITTLAESNGGDLQMIIIQYLVKVVVLIVVVYFLARFVLPFIVERAAKSGEFLFIFTVAWCFSVASVLHLIGFSIEIGAIIAGLTLGSSPFQGEISSRIKPLRDFFIVLFFVILGAQMTVTNALDAMLPALILSAFITFGNPLILYIIFRRLKFTRRNSFLIGITASQVSEFGFVLLYTAAKVGHIEGFEIEIFTIVALITIVVSSYSVTYSEKLYQFMLPFFQIFGPDHRHQSEDKDTHYDVWVMGYRRIGWKVCEALSKKKTSYAVVDFNPKAIKRLNSQGINSFFGDVADVEFLSELSFVKSKLVISTISDTSDQVTMIRFIRKINKKIKIIATLYEPDGSDDLYKAGADYVIMPHFVGGNWLANIITTKKWTTKTFDNLKKEQQKDLRTHSLPGFLMSD